MDARWDGIEGRLEKLVARGDAAPAEDGWRVRGHTTCAAGSLADTGRGLAVKQVRFDIPFSWPPSQGPGPGTVSVRGIRFRDRDLGGLDGRVVWKKDRVEMQAAVDNSVLPAVKTRVRLEAPFAAVPPTVRLNMTGERDPSAGPVRLERLLPALSGFEISGGLRINVDGMLTGKGISARASAELTDGSVAAADRRIYLNGLSAGIEMPLLPALSSAASQHVRVSEIKAGDLVFSDADLQFRLDPAGTLFVEQAVVAWCGGRVQTQSFEIVPGREDYAVTLFCDRLKISEMMGQLGVGQAETGGVVNGRIPLRLKNGRISFQDGFLYTTPGLSGQIRLESEKLLPEGLPMDTPQFAQLDLTQEALKDYQYDWIRLRLNTEGEMLTLKMETDGKPAKPLPFVYDRSFGGFARVTAEHPGSRFQGISLDVNFMLPVNDILHYGGAVKRMME